MSAVAYLANVLNTILLIWYSILYIKLSWQVVLHNCSESLRVNVTCNGLLYTFMFILILYDPKDKRII